MYLVLRGCPGGPLLSFTPAVLGVQVRNGSNKTFIEQNNQQNACLAEPLVDLGILDVLQAQQSCFISMRQCTAPRTIRTRESRRHRTTRIRGDRRCRTTRIRWGRPGRMTGTRDGRLSFGNSLGALALGLVVHANHWETIAFEADVVRNCFIDRLEKEGLKLSSLCSLISGVPGAPKSESTGDGGRLTSNCGIPSSGRPPR